MDLWVDGLLYPNDPLTNTHPTFKSLFTFLQCVGAREQGLLGYYKRFSPIKAFHAHWWMHKHQNLAHSTTLLQQQISQVENKTQSLKQQME